MSWCYCDTNDKLSLVMFSSCYNQPYSLYNAHAHYCVVNYSYWNSS